MMPGRCCAAAVIIFLALAGCAPEQSTDENQQLDISAFDLVDLTHPYDESTIYWPSSPSGFELEKLNYGPVDGGWFYAANAFSSPEHGGTHIDAPIHFFEGGQTVDAIPLHNLMGNAVVIDVTRQVALDADYLLSRDDIDRFEGTYGQIEPGTIVLLRTGWSDHWPDRLAYYGDDRPGRTDDLHFPSFGVEAAALLINERKASMIGVDTASIDYGQSVDFKVHRLAGAANVPGLENLTNLDLLPPTGVAIIALPMKIGGGSGGPVRVVALVPR